MFRSLCHVKYDYNADDPSMNTDTGSTYTVGGGQGAEKPNRQINMMSRDSDKNEPDTVQSNNPSYQEVKARLGV